MHIGVPSPTRNSWKGWPTWNSRKACSLQRVGIAYRRYQPNQELLEGLADLEFQEGPLSAVSERHHSRRSPVRNSGGSLSLFVISLVLAIYNGHRLLTIMSSFSLERVSLEGPAFVESMEVLLSQDRAPAAE